MEKQMIKNSQKTSNQNRDNFGLDAEGYQMFRTAFSELSYSVAHNDFSLATLFSSLRNLIGKKNFYRLLTTALHLSESEISDINRKISGLQQVPMEAVWNTVGYRGIQKLMSMTPELREQMLSMLRSQGENLTQRQFYSLYTKLTSKKLEGTRSVRPNDRSNSDRSNARKNGESKSKSKSKSKSNQTITIKRSELEKMIRRSVETIVKTNKSRKHGASKQLVTT